MTLGHTLRALVAAALATTSMIGTGSSPIEAADVASVNCDALPVGSTPEAAPLISFTAVAPRRLVDTRTGIGGPAAPVGDGCVMRLSLDAAALPDEAAALSLSITALGSEPGYLSVFPCLAGVPPTSNLNTRGAGIPTPNLVVAMPDATGQVCIFSRNESDLIIDVTGWWTERGDQRFTSIPPVRVDDSRNDVNRLPVAARSVRTVDLAGIVPPGTTAVVGNLTVTEPIADGFISAFPCGTPVPNTSNLNFLAGESRAVAMIIGVDAASRLCLRSIVDHHVVVDISGYYSPAPQFGPTAALRPLAGRRLADSRSGEGGWTTKFGDGTIRKLRPVTELASATQATAVVLNVVATEADSPGFVTVYPCDAEVPLASAVNYTADAASTNLVTVELSATGEVCFFTRSAVHLVVDLFGVMTAPDGMLVERLTFGEYTWPPFTADGADYVVECGNAGVDLQLDLLTGATARVNGVTVTAGTIDLPVGDDDLTWLQLERGGLMRNHWFRCVPAGFPRLEIDRVGTPAPGWYLTTLRTGPDDRTFAMILDERGAPVWYKRMSQIMIDLKRRPDGRLLMTPSLGPRYGIDPDSGYQIMSLSGTLVDEHTTVDDPADPGVEYPTDHHDYVPLPNGGRAMLSYPLLDNQDLTVLGSSYLADDVIADGVVQEIDGSGNLVWSWRTSDHVGYDEVTFPIRWDPTPAYAGGEVDVFHLNSLDQVGDGSGDYLVSARHLDAVLRIDRASGDLDWILGSLPPTAPNKSGAPRLTIVNDPLGGPRRPHDARMSGNLLTLFDNRTDTSEPARAVAYEIDALAGTATLVWQIEQPDGLSSPGLGSNRVAADGSVLVDWGGGLQPVFEEFDADRNTIMRITQIDGGVSYRIVKEPPSSFSAAMLRASAGGLAEGP